MIDRKFTQHANTITYKSRLTQKNGTKKPMLFLASMAKTGLTHDFFFEFSVGPFEVVEVVEVERSLSSNFDIFSLILAANLRYLTFRHIWKNYFIHCHNILNYVCSL